MMVVPPRFKMVLMTPGSAPPVARCVGIGGRAVSPGWASVGSVAGRCWAPRLSVAMRAGAVGAPPAMDLVVSDVAVCRWLAASQWSSPCSAWALNKSFGCVPALGGGSAVVCARDGALAVSLRGVTRSPRAGWMQAGACTICSASKAGSAWGAGGALVGLLWAPAGLGVRVRRSHSLTEGGGGGGCAVRREWGFPALMIFRVDELLAVLSWLHEWASSAGGGAGRGGVELPVGRSRCWSCASLCCVVPVVRGLSVSAWALIWFTADPRGAGAVAFVVPGG